LTDTVKLRLTESQKNRAFPVVAPKGNFVVAGKELRFAVSDLITAVDTSLIQLVNPADTSSIQQYSWRIEQNEWVIDTRSFPSEKVLFSFESGAIQGACGTANLRNTVTITLRPEKE